MMGSRNAGVGCDFALGGGVEEGESGVEQGGCLRGGVELWLALLGPLRDDRVILLEVGG